MAVEYKDYYKTLGVSRTASDDDIRKAFRKLAREYHPDVAKDKSGAEDKFKEINEAYEVLSDPEKRSKYNTLGSEWKQGSEFRPPPGWNPAGAGGRYRTTGGHGGFTTEDVHFGGTGFSDFFESLFGSFSGSQRPGRSQFRPGGGPGGGFAQMPGRDIEADLLVSLEEAMRGSTRSITLRREGGKSETYQVRIPAGVREGQRLRLAGRGEAGGRGSRGDLFLRVRLERHPYFRVEDGNLFYDLELAPWEMVLGAQLKIPTLEGEVQIKIPAGTQSGRRLRLREKGMTQPGGKRGDLFVVAKIQVPSEITDEERELWEKLAARSSFSPR